jgi:hypothetical protein
VLSFTVRVYWGKAVYFIMSPPHCWTWFQFVFITAFLLNHPTDDPLDTSSIVCTGTSTGKNKDKIREIKICKNKKYNIRVNRKE